MKKKANYSAPQLLFIFEQESGENLCKNDNKNAIREKAFGGKFRWLEKLSREAGTGRGKKVLAEAKLELC